MLQILPSSYAAAGRRRVGCTFCWQNQAVDRNLAPGLPPLFRSYTFGLIIYINLIGRWTREGCSVVLPVERAAGNRDRYGARDASMTRVTMDLPIFRACQLLGMCRRLAMMRPAELVRAAAPRTGAMRRTGAGIAAASRPVAARNQKAS